MELIDDGQVNYLSRPTAAPSWRGLQVDPALRAHRHRRLHRAALGAVALGRRASRQRRGWGWFASLVYLATVVSVTILGVTSFYSVIRFGVLDGWWLFAHMFGAGAFVFVLPVLAITWGLANRFGRRAVGEDESRGEDARFFWLPKLMFWLLLVSGLAVCLTMLLSMLPLFGTEGLEILLDIHRYTGLLVVVALVIHLYCMIIQRARLR